jgi:serine protease AprX
MALQRRQGSVVGLLVRLAGAAVSVALVTGSPALATDVEIPLPNGHSLFTHATRVSDIVTRSVPGTATSYVTWQEHTPDGVVTMYTATVDGVTFSEPRILEHTLELRFARFDPTQAQPAVPAELAAGADTKLWIVQFDVPGLPEFTKGVRTAGGDVHQFLPYNAYIVRVPDELSRARISALPYVRAVLPYHPAFRLDENLRAQLFPEGGNANTPRGKGSDAPRKYFVQTIDRAMNRAVADAVTKAGGAVDNLPVGDRVVTASLTRSQLTAILRLDQVLWIDEWSPVSADMDLVRQLGGANWLRDNLGFTGQGVRGEVIDLGCRTTHVDFQNPAPLMHGTQSGDQSHGTSTYGIVFGKGLGQVQGTGMLPGAEQGIFCDWDLTPDRWTEAHQLVDPDGPYRAVLQSSSVGNAQTTAYTSVSSTMDDAIFDNDILMCQSQSNTGTQSSRPQAWAKNIVSVGATYHYNNILTTDDCWCNGGSTGPAADGRIKPDLCFYYDAIFTTTNTSNNAYTTSFGGTSAATPITAGHFGLLMQMWNEGVFGRYGHMGSVFESRPHASTAKALMINTARQYPVSQNGNTRTRQGWGVPNVQDLYQIGSQAYIVNEEQVLAPLASMSYTFTVPAGAPSFKSTMIYSDIAGTTSALIHRINDLDLKVTSPSGLIYWGNNGLGAGLWSTSGGNRDTKDTVENVYIQNPEAGAWVVTVIAAEVNQDGHVETHDNDVDYALVVTGAPIQTCPADWNHDGVVNSLDVGEFINDWFADQANGTHATDLDGNNVSNSTDVAIMVDRYLSGC